MIELSVSPKNLSIPRGQLAAFECYAGNSRPRPIEITWYNGSERIINRSDPRVFISELSGNLFIRDVQASDEGLYHCVAENNIAGRAASEEATLSLLAAGIDPSMSQCACVHVFEGLKLTILLLIYNACTCISFSQALPLPLSPSLSLSLPLSLSLSLSLSPSPSPSLSLSLSLSYLFPCFLFFFFLADEFSPQFIVHPRSLTVLRGEAYSVECYYAQNYQPQVLVDIYGLNHGSAIVHLRVPK